MRLPALLALAAAMLAISCSASAAAPTTIKARYDVFKDSLRIGTAQESFEQRAGRYTIVSESVPSELLAAFIRTRIKVQSRGTVNAKGLRPEQFDYERLDDASKNISARFDWSAMRLDMSFDGHSENAALSPGTQDRLSIMYQFMFLPVAKLKQIAVSMTNGKKIEHYDYKVAGVETLATAVGKLNTVHLIKQLSGSDNNSIEVWLASERGLVPVRLVIVESDGSTYEQVITQLDFK